MNVKNLFFLFLLGFLFSGCSNFYHYSVKPTPINQKSAKYNVNYVDVALHNLNNMSKTNRLDSYPNEEQLSLIIKESFNNKLKELNRYCEIGLECYSLKMDINYQRVFNLNSNSVTYPVFSYFTKVYSNEKLLVEFNQIELTLDRNMLTDLSRLSNIGSEEINLDDEIEDIKILSDEIVKDVIINIGE